VLKFKRKFRRQRVNATNCKWFSVNDQRDAQFFTMYLFLFLTLHVSSTSCSSSGETNCVNTTSGNCRWPYDLHTIRTPTQSDGYQSCVDTICLSWWWTRCAWNMWRVKNKNTYILKKCASRWSVTKNHYMMHGQQNVKNCKSLTITIWHLRVFYMSRPLQGRQGGRHVGGTC
jgi:hypothetical protein